MNFPESRLLTPSRPRTKYIPSNSSVNDLDHLQMKGLHFGQRKLLLSEVEFFTKLLKVQQSRDAEVDKSGGAGTRLIVIVYAGAANGSHLPFLFDMFPRLKFVLIDPAPFCPPVVQISQLAGSAVLEIVNGYCTDELCLRIRRQYGGTAEVPNAMYLISDIRSGVPQKLTNKQHTEMIQRDNTWQASWCSVLRADGAMLKFHPPYPKVTDPNARDFDPLDDTPNTIRYLEGALVLGVWAPKSSSEVRLVVATPFRDDVVPAQREYDCREFEEQCYHNNISGRYAQDVEAERCILTEYLAHVAEGRAADSNSRKPTTAVGLSRVISLFLGFPLLTPLDTDFTECDARLVAMLYLTRRGDEEYFAKLRGVLTTPGLIALIKRKFGIGAPAADGAAEWSESTTADECLDVGGVELPPYFWSGIATPKNLAECYCIPALRMPFVAAPRQKKPRTWD